MHGKKKEEQKILATGYLIKLPKDVIINSLSDFLLNLSFSNLALTSRFHYLNLVNSLLARKKPFDIVLEQLKILHEKNSVMAPPIAGTINNIINNINSTGKIYNSKNAAILKSSLSWRFQYTNIVWCSLYNDAKALQNLILMKFLINSLDSFKKCGAFFDFKYSDWDLSIEWERPAYPEEKEYVEAVYIFLEKYKNHTLKVNTDILDVNIQIPLFYISLWRLTDILSSADEKLMDENIINPYIRLFIVFIHQKYYYGFFKDSRAHNYEQFFTIKESLKGKNDEITLKKWQIISRIEIGMLASLLARHYLENNNPSSSAKHRIQKIVDTLVKIREGELPITAFAAIQTQLPTLARTDETLHSVILKLSSHYHFPKYEFFPDTGNPTTYFKGVLDKIEIKLKENKEQPKALPSLVPLSLLTEPSREKPRPTESGLLERLIGFDEKTLSADIKQIPDAMKDVKAIYKRVRKIFNRINQLSDTGKIPINELWLLKTDITRTQQSLFTKQADLVNPAILMWHNKLAKIHADIVKVMGKAIVMQPPEELNSSQTEKPGPSFH